MDDSVQTDGGHPSFNKLL